MKSRGASKGQVHGSVRRSVRILLDLLLCRDSQYRARREDGQSLVELALALPILMAFIFGLMQVCLLFYTWEMISECAREGSRYAIVHGPTCETAGGVSCEATASQVSSYVSGIGYPNLGNGTMSVSTSFPNGELLNQPAIVTVTYTFPYRIPGYTTKNLSMQSSSEMYIVQ
jgi:Flp pilus assembly protein TadG